jgi:hypothetical protein
MLAAASYIQILDSLSHYERRDGLRLAVLVFCRPESPLAREEIFPSLSYYHFRSGPATNFYFAGFEQAEAPDGEAVVMAGEAGIRWKYSAKGFNDLRREIERRTTWVYSGGCDLVVTGVRFASTSSRAQLDFSSTVTAKLDEMRSEGIIPRVDAFLEGLFRFADTFQGDRAAHAFSSSVGRRLSKEALRDLLIGTIPGALQARANAAFHYAAKDASRPRF